MDSVKFCGKNTEKAMFTSPVCTGFGNAITDWNEVGPASTISSLYCHSIQLKLNGASVTTTRRVYRPSSMTRSRLVVSHVCQLPVAEKGHRAQPGHLPVEVDQLQGHRPVLLGRGPEVDRVVARVLDVDLVLHVVARIEEAEVLASPIVGRGLDLDARLIAEALGLNPPGNGVAEVQVVVDVLHGEGGQDPAVGRLNLVARIGQREVHGRVHVLFDLKQEHAVVLRIRGSGQQGQHLAIVLQA